MGRFWGGLGRSWGALGAVLGRLGRSWSLLGALFYCVGCVGDRGSRPSEPREARRAKAEALMIMYFHVVNCLWLLGWFGDVLSCLGCMLLCIFVLESFSRCGRPRARFVELIRCSRPWACFGELKRRFPFSAAQVSRPWRPYFPSLWQDLHSSSIAHAFTCFYNGFWSKMVISVPPLEPET